MRGSLVFCVVVLLAGSVASTASAQSMWDNGNRLWIGTGNFGSDDLSRCAAADRHRSGAGAAQL